MYIKRNIEKRILELKDMFKVLLITGPRQVGKTTTLKHLFKDTYKYVTLDDITALKLAKDDPKMFFLNNKPPLIIDEAQLAPELFREIKRIVDNSNDYGQIILTGSQAFHLMDNVSETLAGRVGIIEFPHLSTREINNEIFNEKFIPKDEYFKVIRTEIDNDRLWDIIHRGGMPELYNNPAIDLKVYYASYVRTYLERDVRSIINISDSDKFFSFLMSLASRTGTLLNYKKLSSEIGVSGPTIKSWMKVLEASGIIYLVKPFSNNNLTRTISTPVVYFSDTGLVSYLLGWMDSVVLRNGASSGAILETYVVSEIIKSYKNEVSNYSNIYFYRDKDDKEIDLIIVEDGTLYPIEIKKSMNPKVEMTKNFYLLDKSLGYKRGISTILCLIEVKTYLKEDVIAYPIKDI